MSVFNGVTSFTRALVFRLKRTVHMHYFPHFLKQKGQDIQTGSFLPERQHTGRDAPTSVRQAQRNVLG